MTTVDPAARLRRQGQYGWPDAWLLHRRLVAPRPEPAIRECSALLGAGGSGLYAACAAVAWSAGELVRSEAELEPVVSGLAEALSTTPGAGYAATTLAGLASGGLTLGLAQSSLCRLVTDEREASLPARLALKTLAAGGRLLPAAGELLLASGAPLLTEIAETAWWHGMALTERARAILTDHIGSGPPTRVAVARAERMLGLSGGTREPQEPVTQAEVDAIAGDAAATELAVRIQTVARLYRGARGGANLDRAVPGLTTALADQRRPTKALLAVLSSTANVSWYAACALGTAVATSADPGAILAELHRGLAQRRRDTRHAAATALGVAAAVLGECDPLAAVLARDEPPLVLTAMVGVREGLRQRPDSGLTVPALVDWLAANGFDPAWCFDSRPATRLLGGHLRATTRDGLGQLVGALGSPRRSDALEALAVVAGNGTDMAVAIPVIAGTLLCGDWRVVPREVLACLSAAAVAGAPVTSAAPWLADHLVPGAAGTSAAATVVDAAILQGTDPAPFVDRLMAVAGQPFAPPALGAPLLEPVRASLVAARTLARLAGQDVELEPTAVVAW